MRKTKFLWTCKVQGKAGSIVEACVPAFVESTDRKAVVLDYIKNAFPEECLSQTGIDLSRWGEGGERIIPDEDVERLRKLHILRDSSSGDLSIKQVFAAWCALLYIVHDRMLAREMSLPVIGVSGR